MTQSEDLAAFVRKASFEDLSTEAKGQFKIRVLDGLACAVGALGTEPVKRVKQPLRRLGRQPALHPDEPGGHNGSSVDAPPGRNPAPDVNG